MVKTKPRASTITSATIALHSQSVLSMGSPWIRVPFPDTTHELGHKKEDEKCPSHCGPGQVKQSVQSFFGRWPQPPLLAGASVRFVRSCLGEWQEALSFPHPSAEHPLVAQDPVRDLFISAKDLFVEANGVLISETPLRSLPLAVTHEAVALYEMQMLLSGLTPAIFISLGSESASRCNLSGIFWFL
ncbi:MAG: hypothetical protein JO012_17795 [Hyphomicrobiales bacterium]|nr:hypothetical protein [Hyphomicrobiales bacterium]